MCNHYRSDLDALPSWAEYAGFRVRSVPETADIWPKRSAAIARIVGGERVIDAVRWGVPFTMKGKRPGTTITKAVTNVRNLDSSFWRSMLADPARRCLVPFSAFAEPVIGGGRAEHWFTVLDRPVAAFAGLWRPSDEGDVFAFLTSEPNALVAPLHPKAMPVILAEETYERWLNAPADEVRQLQQPYPSQLMTLAAG